MWQSFDRLRTISLPSTPRLRRTSKGRLRLPFQQTYQIKTSPEGDFLFGSLKGRSNSSETHGFPTPLRGCLPPAGKQLFSRPLSCSTPISMNFQIKISPKGNILFGSLKGSRTPVTRMRTWRPNH